VVDQATQPRLFGEAPRHDAVGEVSRHRQAEDRSRQPGRVGAYRQYEGRRCQEAEEREPVRAGQPQTSGEHDVECNADLRRAG